MNKEDDDDDEEELSYVKYAIYPFSWNDIITNIYTYFLRG